ncbi:MAG: NfeD family protein [Clostridia bacterium]|nr:NfeD family protein [Clostridia bacterium]
MSPIVIWAVALVVLLAIEGATAQLVTIWFAAGALAALIAAALHAPIWLQVVLFVVVSGITLVATRPLVKKIVKRKTQPLNADRCIGETAVVTEEIDNIRATGAVKVGGVVWTARSSGGEIIEKDKNVVIEKIEGVKLIVKEI